MIYTRTYESIYDIMRKISQINENDMFVGNYQLHALVLATKFIRVTRNVDLQYSAPSVNCIQRKSDGHVRSFGETL